MNNARQPRCPASYMRLFMAIFVCAAIGLMTLVGVNAAQPTSRGRGEVTEYQASHIQRLVTGDAERIGNVVAGTGATLKFYFTPRPPLLGTEPSLAYPTGWNISGQKLTVSGGGFASAWITQIEGWDPDGNGDVLLRSFSDVIDVYSLFGDSASPPNTGCDVIYSPVGWIPCQKTCAGGTNNGSPCNGNSNCPGGACSNPCPTILGENGPRCGYWASGICDSIWQNTDRADWVLGSYPPQPEGIFDGLPCFHGPCFGGTTPLGVAVSDAGLRYYTGTVTLQVPACCKGTYKMTHFAELTFANDQAQPANNIPIAALISGQLECIAGSCCTDFTSTSQASCTSNILLSECNALSSSNLHIFRDGIDCTTPCGVECVTAADCDDHKLCTADSCTSDGHCVHTHTDAICDDGVICTIDTCAANGTCVNTPDDSRCDDGLFCNGVEYCTAAGCAYGDPPCGFGETCDETTDSCELVPIPTVSQWGLTILALLVLIAAKIRFRIQPDLR
ncbi:MAG: hypothetical protein HY287_05925 [Planctomycetes bacterium]|nr:hypothetical protein [Planctomycetota bacterium]MBI3833850.1 hypothetical protein [Planctomycetota bacterium]